MTIEQLKTFTKISDDVKLKTLFDTISATFEKYEINSVLRKSHFLAQIAVESADFTHVRENLNYSAKALLATFPTHFNKNEAELYARQPVKIGNRAYANRLGNGDEASGDGYKFRGAGYIQITGKINFMGVGKALNIDLINHPELLEQPQYAMLSAGFFWNDRNLNAIADKSGDDVTRITKIINGGLNGLKDRQAHYDLIKKILSN